ncbi:MULTISPECIES: hypothetical protein [Bradyrhizobium]|uniref:hypothetical protein n=1 Tax=Bradyrhizobium TaxID=374 RepID=UPI0011DE34ED
MNVQRGACVLHRPRDRTVYYTVTTRERIVGAQVGRSRQLQLVDIFAHLVEFAAYRHLDEDLRVLRKDHHAIDIDAPNVLRLAFAVPNRARDGTDLIFKRTP